MTADCFLFFSEAEVILWHKEPPLNQSAIHHQNYIPGTVDIVVQLKKGDHILFENCFVLICL